MRRPKEMLRPIAHRGWRSRASASRKTRPRWNHRQIPRHHARAAQLRVRGRRGRHPARTEVSRVHRRQSPANMSIMNVRDIREAHSRMQRSDATIPAIPAMKADYAKPSRIPTPPRMEIIARPNR